MNTDNSATNQTVVKATFTWNVYDGHDGYSVKQYRNADTGKLFVAAGIGLPGTKNLLIHMHGEWDHDRRDKLPHFSMSYYEIPPQSGKSGITAYLTGLKCGVGKVKASMIYDHFGKETWNILSENPWRLVEVDGIGASLTKRIIEANGRCKGVKDVIALFSEANVRITPAQANEFLHYHTASPAEDLRRNPYCSCRIRGITFDMADMLADSLGFPPDDANRVRAFISKALNEAGARGHVCMPQDSLIRQMENRLGINDACCRSALGSAWEQGYIRTTNGMVYSERSYEEETSIAEHIFRLMKAHAAPVADIDLTINDYEKTGICLSEGQRSAVRQVFSSPVCIITGGPGTGKTTVIKAILATQKAILGGMSKPLLLAPTGRAARRMTEATSYPSRTVHSAVGYRGAGTGSYDSATLDSNLIVIDEASMMDQSIASILFSKCASGSRVVLVGDPNQLPSVGAGNVLSDLIGSGCIPTTMLDTIFRQEGNNPIIANAHAINDGSAQLEWGNSFQLFSCSSSQEIINKASDCYLGCVGEQGVDEVILLNPQRRNTEVSVDAFNARLQEKLNPHETGKPEMSVGFRVFRKGDRIMQLQNTDAAANGDIGYIRDISCRSDPESPGDVVTEALIEFNGDGILHRYGTDDMRHVDLAYCSTIHKSQGSEYSTVIMVVSKEHPTMLRRNLVYTGITRAKRNVVIVTDTVSGSEKSALERAIENNQSDMRSTNLALRLKTIFKR